MGFYYDFENADAFATGAIGTPGERTFYMQVRADGRTVSVKCEKQQVAALAQYLRSMLADMPDMTGSVNNATATLQNPVEQDFVLGSVGLGVDRSNMRMVVQLEEMVLASVTNCLAWFSNKRDILFLSTSTKPSNKPVLVHFPASLAASDWSDFQDPAADSSN